jgi:aminoglycoside phosphotransferase (APT) family kinase protein
MAIHDDLLPALALLLGPGARDIVGAGVRAAGGDLTMLRRREVLYRPGRRAVVRYAAAVRWAGAPAVPETLVAIVDVDGPAAGTLVVSAGDLAVGLLRYPEDPALPGLRSAVSATSVAARFGVPAEEVRLDVRTYRPGRRAVVRARVGGRVPDPSGLERYLKVVPPTELGALVDRMTALGGHVPVPEVVEVWPEAGTIVLAAIAGRTIRDVLLTGDRAAVDALPDGGVILDLLDRLPPPTTGAAGLAGKVSRGPLARTAGHAGLLAAVMPDERDRLETLAGRIGRAAGTGPVVTVHGDLHEAQLMIEGDRVVGVLDVDGAGPGRRVHDLATMLGHLVALGDAVPRRRAAIDRWRVRLEPAFERAVDPVELRRTTAAALVGLATGPFRVQAPAWRRQVRRRIASAEAWATAAGA